MNWFAIYTKSRYEKKVYSILKEQGIETYLPMQKRLRQWSDRKKWIEEPLISSYVFVQISQKDYFRVLNTPGVVCYVSFSGRAVPVRESEIDLLKRILATDTELELCQETLRAGVRVEIIAGQLLGVEGELIERKGDKKVVIRITATNHSLLLTIPIQYLRKCQVAQAS
jgi:transcription antitermination factor NusG